MVREIFGKKLGMTQVFTEDAKLVGVTVIEVEPACVLEKISYEKETKVKLGCFKVDEKKVKKPAKGYFSKVGADNYSMIKEVSIDSEEGIEPKTVVDVDLFQEGDIVDVRSKSKGKGFQGGMKRHGWAGQPKSHGSTMHRRLGSAGACTFPGKIIKGINMPGHMGNEFVTIKNLKIVKIDKEKQVLFVKGSVPGARNSVVRIKKVKSK